LAEELARTTQVEDGPCYPTRLQLDADNDLLIINDAITPAVGRITHRSGRLFDARGEPIKHAAIEVWLNSPGRVTEAQDAPFLQRRG